MTEKTEIYPQLKSMFPKVKIQKRSLKWIFVIVALCIVTIVIVYKSELSNACTINQLDIADDMKKYDQTKNPELCDTLNKKIYQFDNDCKFDLEEIDCG